MRIQLLGRGSGLRVSEICLGTALFGTSWDYGATPEEAGRIFDAFIDAGGNFVDSADNYQIGESENILSGLVAGRREVSFWPPSLRWAPIRGLMS
mgnify:CR=1 FL=1